MNICTVDKCDNGGKIRLGFCEKHYWKFRKYGDALGGKNRKSGDGTIDRDGYIRLVVDHKTRRIHRIIIEKALGHAIPEGAVTHHIDGNRTNNTNSNLVLCDSCSYHILLHLREKALLACGNVNWRKCSFCGKYDNPGTMYRRKDSEIYSHRECSHQYYLSRRNERSE